MSAQFNRPNLTNDRTQVCPRRYIDSRLLHLFTKNGPNLANQLSLTVLFLVVCVAEFDTSQCKISAINMYGDKMKHDTTCV